MQDILTMLNKMRRPRLLIRAARMGTQDYSRDRHLRRLLGYGNLPRPAAALMRLVELERALNDSRRENDAGYSLPQHLDVLIALMGEAHLLRTAHSEPTL